MGIPREKLYRFPWSKTDNPGGWVEVTDECDLFCPGCYRHKLEGHRPLKDVKEDILLCQKMTNCDRMAVAGGEPLLYPDILEVVEFIHHHKMKPVLITNGEKLIWDLARDFKKAGLAKYHFHVDCGQKRPGWMGKNEEEMNQLRQRFADLCWDVGGVQCGYNITIFRSSLKYLPDIVMWCWKNIHKVQHVSLVAVRGIPLMEDIEYEVEGRAIDASKFQHTSKDPTSINISTNEMYELLENHFNGYSASAYLGGTLDPETYKFLITINIGSKGKRYGVLGAKSVELVQSLYHYVKGRYFTFLRNPKVGKKIFLLSFFDKQARGSFFDYMKACARNPLRIFEKIYIQSVSLQQPNEYLKGGANLCDGCMNMMIYEGELINSCRLDEYRMLGGLIHPVKERR